MTRNPKVLLTVDMVLFALVAVILYSFKLTLATVLVSGVAVIYFVLALLVLKYRR